MRPHQPWSRRFFAVLVTGSLLVANAARADLRPTSPFGGQAYGAAVTTLADGRILVAGGRNLDNPIGVTDQVWLYDPWADSWTQTTPMANPRYNGAATLLPNGLALVCGGAVGSGIEYECERYDPTTQVWLATRSLPMPCPNGRAVTLNNGKALMFDCSQGAFDLSSTYDATTNTWTPGRNEGGTRNAGPGSAALADGRVLLLGGNGDGAAYAYDPPTDRWLQVAAPAVSRRYTTATLLADGRVLVAGGQDASGSALSSVQLYDPVANSWSNAAPMLKARYSHSAALLPNGTVLVTGGLGSSGAPLNHAEIYDPTANAWKSAPPLVDTRAAHASVALADGGVLVLGGYDGANNLPQPEVYQAPTQTWGAVGALATARSEHTAALLQNGKVLVAGGYTGTTALTSAELFDPATNVWSPAGTMLYTHVFATETLLTSGKVLVAGGNQVGDGVTDADLYDPVGNTWSTGGTMLHLRANATATLLNDGRVLVAGGSDGTNALNSTELYTPGTNSWAPGPDMATPRIAATATRLADGRVLVAGGSDGTFDLASAELYDPTANTWTTVAPMGGPLEGAGSVRLRDGRVLVAGGSRFSTLPNQGTVYDPTTNTWTDTGPDDIGRALDALVIDPTSGQPILVAGTPVGGGGLASVEIYDAATNSWWDDGELSRGLEGASVTMLASGRIIAAGGSQGGPVVGFTQKSPGVAAVSVTNTAFSPVNRSVAAPAGAVRWTVTAGSHSVVDTMRLGPPNTLGNATAMYSSGAMAVGQSYTYTFVAAGSFAYRNAVGTSFTGTIKVPDVAFLSSRPGPPGIYVAFASSRMPGYRFGVAYRFMPTGGSFGAWTTWSPPGSASWSDPHGVLTGLTSGTYQFHSRLLNVATGKMSGYSNAVSVVVP